MAFVPTPKTAKIAIQFLKAGQQCENIFYATTTGTWTATNLAELATVVGSWVVASYLPLLPSDVQWVDVVCTDVSEDGGVQFTGAPTTSEIGSAAGDPMPNNVTLAIHKNSAISGRHSKGRVYPIGITNQQKSTANTVTSGYKTAICNAFDALRSEVAGASGIDAVLTFVEFTNNKVKLAAGVAIQILGFICKDDVVDSQRRRLPGRGR